MKDKDLIFNIDSSITDDFGFSLVDEHEVHSSKLEETSQREKTYKLRLDNLYKTVMPLLTNLAKNPEKQFLKWPDRAAKMNALIKRVNQIVND